MAIQSEQLYSKMVIQSSHGPVDGKDVLKKKTYSNLNFDATDEQIYQVANAIDGLQVPVLMEIEKVTSHLLYDL